MIDLDELLAFAARCLDEDEQAMRETTVGPWEWGPSPGILNWSLDGPDSPYGGRVLGTSDFGCPSRADAAHITSWDPVRVQRLTKALRTLVDEFDHEGRETAWLIALVTALYEGRPGWREEWSA